MKQKLAPRSDAEKLRRLDNRIKHWTTVPQGAESALRVLRKQRAELTRRGA